MKANELRIGNYIGLKHCDYENTPRKVRHTQYPNLVGLERVSINSIPYNNLEPIPLTEEWLLKFGFEQRETCDGLVSDWWIGFNNISHDWLFHITWIKGQTPFYKNGRFEIKHVHQLQNLYFALTNEELILKP